ncbi:amidohydrolase 2 [Coniochaeta ligniaria NRRL 30616]|uniref:Amidohydrolase 2 n=1 Tax=Coniochaeta ligniaria NRRL 30616 TaxID=1408157 RepID=A0A1J7IVI8_9PEZI|nr:amidohydrolase 2 [Coniochaeta ligniaria NRRL 30616]
MPPQILDSHIHLYPSSDLPSLSWYTPTHPLAAQKSVSDYRSATKNLSSGFIFLETDRCNSSSQSWDAPLAEIAWLRRIVTDSPLPSQGHGAGDGALCKAIVPWAPINLGAEKVEEYLAQAEETAGPETWERVKGFRYLLQDKEDGTAVADKFVEGLKVLGRKGFVFDLGVDQHRRGKTQLDEAVEMVDRAHEGVAEGEKVVFILNHLCKPDLSIVNTTSDASFIAWRTAMFTLSKCSRTYMKLSGAFSEMPAHLTSRSANEIFEILYPWLAVVLAAFGPARIMFASDWPVCTVGGGEDAWDKWRQVVERMCYMASLSESDQEMIWSGTAKKAYGIE